MQVAERIWANKDVPADVCLTCAQAADISVPDLPVLQSVSPESQVIL